MKRIFFLALILSFIPCTSEPISKEIHVQVMKIADVCKVPRSIANALQIEESGWWKTGTWGDARAYSPEPSGWPSRGLFSIYMEPKNLFYLLEHFWTAYNEKEIFNVENPIHNAKLALRYLAQLHHDHGSWFVALCYYNAGTKDAPLKTLQYAQRICDAEEP
jgi:nuclear transport factor 2 (NTF2) superfamily protein